MSASIIKLNRPTPGSGNLYGAAVIDDGGREIPITEHMIQHCLQAILQADTDNRCRQSAAGRRRPD